ncbi:hypothetical protein DPMN_091358, partial [Dreissena polymorpha]
NRHQSECLRQTRTSCEWWAVDGLDSFQSDLTYYMAVSILNNITQVWYPQRAVVNTIVTEEIVEPAPVEFRSSVANSTCVVLSWKHSKTIRLKAYRLDFRSQQDTEWETKHLGNAEEQTLCGLRPFTRYDFSITCRPLLFRGRETGFWSRPAQISIQTDEDVPNVGPEILPGSYTEQRCLTHYCTTVMLYWKPLSLRESNGNVTFYQLSWTSSRSNGWVNVTMTNTQGHVFVSPGEAHIVRIWAATRKGLSAKPSTIVIPAVHQKPPIPEHRVEANNNNLTIYWSLLSPVAAVAPWSNMTSYTVFWCHGNENCQEPIRWQTVPISEDQFTLELPQFRSHMFGVALNAVTSSGEAISSGFKWNTCIYRQHAVPLISPGNVRRSAYQPNGGLSVDWDTLSCDVSDAYIVSYTVNVCPSLHGDNCTGALSTYSIKGGQSSISVQGLTVGDRYRVWISAYSAAGSGPNSEAIYSIIIDRSLKPGEIAGLVVGGLVVITLVIFVVVTCCRRLFRSLKDRYQYPVHIEIPTSLHPLPPIPISAHEISPCSDDSDGIYEKIVDCPPSPQSESESTTGVHAPLLQYSWKFSAIKSAGYSVKEDARNSEDSGRGSAEHSSDTLLTRKHPSHFINSNQSESDSGIIVAVQGPMKTFVSSEGSGKTRGRGQNGISYSLDETGDSKGTQVNPYSCVNIVDDIPCKSGQLIRKLSQSHDDVIQCKGSTISLPSCKRIPFSQKALDLRAQSAGNDLDLESGRKLSSMKEARELECRNYSDNGTLDQTDYHFTGEVTKPVSIKHSMTNGTAMTNGYHKDNSYGSHGGKWLNSYIKVSANDIPEIDLHDFVNSNNHDCVCGCHTNNVKTNILHEGYVSQAVFVDHTEVNCLCRKHDQTYQYLYDNKEEFKLKMLQEILMGKNGARPVSQVVNLPPHFFESMSKLPVDPARTTEL